MKLRILQSASQGWMAIFDFGVLEAMLIMIIDRRRLQQRWLQGNNEKEHDEREDNEEEDTGGDCLPTFGHSTLSSGRKRKAGPTPSAKARVKRSRATKGKQLELFLEWRGRETCEGVVQTDINDDNKDVLKFPDPAWSTSKALSP
ncbi:MAG: hypothetical protein Q9217_004980 [Psora testacea]